MRCEWKEFLHLIALPLKGEKHWLSKFKSTQANIIEGNKRAIVKYTKHAFPDTHIFFESFVHHKFQVEAAEAAMKIDSRSGRRGSKEAGN